MKCSFRKLHKQNKMATISIQITLCTIPVDRLQSGREVGYRRHVHEIGAVTVTPPGVVVQVDVLEPGAPVERTVSQRDQAVTGQPQLEEIGRVGELVQVGQVRYPTVAEVQQG